MQSGMGASLKGIDLDLNVGFGTTLFSNAFDVFIGDQQESLPHIFDCELSFQPIHGMSIEREPAVMHLDRETRRNG